MKDKLTYQEVYDDFYTVVERDTYSCKKCKIEAKYSMNFFNKQYKKRFEKMVKEIYNWYKSSPRNDIYLADLGTFSDVLIGKEPKYSDNIYNQYKWRNV